MGETCSTHGGDAEHTQNFSQTIYWEGQLRRLVVDENIIIKRILEYCNGFD
jgi:hypothetical protein